MRAFKIYLNGKKLCLVGIGKDGVLSTTITYVPFRNRRETQVYIGGLILPQNEHVVCRRSRLRVGDELRAEIVQSETVDKPRERFPRDLSAEAEREKRYVLRMAKKLGWEIQRSKDPD